MSRKETVTVITTGRDKQGSKTQTTQEVDRKELMDDLFAAKPPEPAKPAKP